MKKFLFLLLTLTVSITSCGNSKKSVEEAFKKDISIIKKGEREALVKAFPKEYDVVGGYFYLDTIKKLEYSIKNIQIKGNEATVNVAIKIPDLSSYAKEYSKALLEQEKNRVPPVIEKFAYSFFKPKLESPDLKYKEMTINVKYLKKLSGWKIYTKWNTLGNYENELFKIIDSERLIPVNYLHNDL